ncbi:hypothetical protein ACFQMF_10680 [Halorubrum rutilum]|uniref:Uncharacterized protein n=1 Tax=Halorubrum rutilum TaxID=1364933 RepID=A0ABD6ALK7_9EURY|nr:hypothetical protein [Halorubrum rutilum]
MFDHARELDDDETVTETIRLADGTTIVGVDPFRPIDSRLVDDDGGREPVDVEETTVSHF